MSNRLDFRQLNLLLNRTAVLIINLTITEYNTLQYFS